TERKRAEEELREALRRAEESGRLKSAFLANISHEIRTPLNVILGSSALIAERFTEAGDESHRELLQAMDRGGRRLLTTVHQVLDYSRITTGTFQVRPATLELASIVSGLVEEHRERAAEKGLTLSWSNEAAGAAVSFDEHSLTATIRSLLDNAVKFTNRGEVSVRLCRVPPGGLRLSVRDTGVGIDPAYLSRLFEPFSQEDSTYTRRFEGAGLGLALAKRHLELNGASLSVESRKGGGSVFTIHLQEATREAAFAASERSRPTILVVEDDRETQAYMTKVLKPHYDLLIAASAPEARKHLSEHPRKVRLILMDLGLEGAEDGLTLTRELRRSSNSKHVPIVAVTAHAFATDRQNALAAGCNRYLAKPVTPTTLLSTVKETLTARSSRIAR
ncbi:MAG: hybrid sensor histidine kinase/response regulator, partial [Candidatus Binatia bacterium]